MSAEDNVLLVRRYYEDMCDGRRLDLAGALFAADCAFHDPQIPGVVGPQAIAAAIKMYQTGVEGRWAIEDIFASGDDRVTVRWTGSGVHTGDVMGIPPAGNAVRVDGISVFRIAGGKIAEAWEVWDTLTFLQQLGVVSKEKDTSAT
jgi:steroid delta-isomerase-like uncharacterized protein